MGNPIASTEPNASRRITTAKARPSASDDGASNSAKIWPPSSMSVALDRRGDRVDVLLDLECLLQRHVGELDVGVGDLPGQGTALGDLALAARRERARHGDPVDLVDLVEELLERLPHRRIGHRPVGTDHDGAAEAGALTAEVAVEDVGALLALDVRQLELGLRVRADAAEHDAADEQHRDPQDHDDATAVVAPTSESSEHRILLGGRRERGSVCGRSPTDGCDGTRSNRQLRPCSQAVLAVSPTVTCVSAVRPRGKLVPSVDVRTRTAADVAPVDPGWFFDEELPRLARERGSLVAAGGRELAPRPLVGGGRRPDLDARARRRSRDRDLAVAGARPRTCGSTRRTWPTSCTTSARRWASSPAATSTCRAGRLDDFLDWWVVLRGLIDARPVHTAGAVTFTGTDGEPLDLAHAFHTDDDPREMGHFLAEAGFLHIAGVFTEDEMGAVSAEMDAAAAGYEQGDGRSWWAKTADGDRPARAHAVLPRAVADDRGRSWPTTACSASPGSPATVTSSASRARTRTGSRRW